MMRAFLTWSSQIKVAELFLRWKPTSVPYLSCIDVQFGNQDPSVPSTAKTPTLPLSSSIAQLSKSALLTLISFFIPLLLALRKSCVSNFFSAAFSRRVSN